MNLLTVILVLVVVGILLLVINRYIPMDAKIKTILNWVVVAFVIFWLLKAIGAFEWLKGVNI